MPEKSKAEIIEERKNALPLPDDPPVKSDWNSASDSINVKTDERQEELSNTEVADTGVESAREDVDGADATDANLAKK